MNQLESLPSKMTTPAHGMSEDRGIMHDVAVTICLLFGLNRTLASTTPDQQTTGCQFDAVRPDNVLSFITSSTTWNRFSAFTKNAFEI